MPALLTSLQSVWLNQPPQASSDYLSVQLGCSAAQGNLCYIVNNHTCSTTSPPSGEGETHSSPPEQEGLILSKKEIDLPTTSAAKKHSRPSATAATKTKEADRALQQLWATSEDHKVHSVEKSPGQLQDARRLRRKPPRSRRPRHKQGGNY